jgi:hypothetical protein
MYHSHHLGNSSPRVDTQWMYMSMGLCNSMWSCHHLPQRMCTSMAVARFISELLLYYNHSLYLSYNIPTCILGYISAYSLTSASCISAATPSYYLHVYSCLPVCRSSLLLASLCSITLSSHSLPLRLALLSSHLLDHYHSKVGPLGSGTCVAILIHACASSSASASLSVTYAIYFFGPCHDRIVDVGCVSLSTSMGIVGLKVAIIF